MERVPLAERMRPKTLDEVIGQTHLLDDGEILRQIVKNKEPVSLILWGPPGSGKTTLARIIAQGVDAEFIELSAVTSGKKDVERVVEIAKANWGDGSSTRLSRLQGSDEKHTDRYKPYREGASQQLTLQGAESASGSSGSADEQAGTARRTVLFVDEIHRFNKAQQDAFLPHVESGLITLIGATTENPSFEVINPLLSRSRVLVLEPLNKDEIITIVNHALKELKKTKSVSKDAIDYLAELSGGDARVALGNLELALGMIGSSSESSSSGSKSPKSGHNIPEPRQRSGNYVSSAQKNFDPDLNNSAQEEKAQTNSIKKVTIDIVKVAAQKKVPGYDKKGEMHYNVISAFIKSMRGSNVDATLYYLARMLDAGEDPKFVARRMVIFASEDIGLAGNGALGLALSAFQAVERVGMPECQYILFHVATALAKSEKSRQTSDAMGRAQQLAKQYPDSPVPLYLRNAPTKLMKDLGYNKDYKWEADFKPVKGFLPDELNNQKIF